MNRFPLQGPETSKPPRRAALSVVVIVMRRNVLGRPGSDLLFQALRLSTIGAGEFNGLVRDGIGFRLPANTTRSAKDGLKQSASGASVPAKAGIPISKRKVGFPFSALHARTTRMGISNERIKTIELLVPVSSMRCRTYTPGLSTWWSTTALKGELVSRWVSRLDAFSDYPVRT